MVSAINPALPTYGDPTTQSVRDNFQHAYDEITALNVATAGGPFLPLDPSPITATGSTASRSLQDRAIDVANVLDYGAGLGGDDALAIRNAIASGKTVIYVPPGIYTMKSTVPPWGHAADPVCIQVLNANNLTIIAYGATFLVDNSISGPTPTSTFAFENNCKHCSLLGGTIVGNSTGLTPSQENVAITFTSVTDLTVRDVKVTGKFLTAIAGVYAYDSLFENLQAFNNANAIDIAHVENVTFKGCRFQANPSSPVTGINLHYDAPTLADNAVTTEVGASRSLRGGNANNLRVLDCVFQGFGNGISIDAIAGCLISRTIIRDGLMASTANTSSGIALACGAAAVTAGLTTTDIDITDCDIYGNGVTAGGGLGTGIFFNPATGTLANVNILNNRIHDNTNSGISGLGGAISGLVISGNDFRTRSGSSLQTAAIGAAFAAVLSGGAGIVRNNVTVTPISSEVPVYPNFTTVSWRDSAGATQPIFGVNNTNVTFMRPGSAAANVVFQNFAGASMLTVDSGGNKITASVPMACVGNLAVGGALQENRVAMAANNIDCNAGDFFTKTITAQTTLTVSNVPVANTVSSFILELTNGGAFTVTWWSGVTWPFATAPTLTVSGVDVLAFYTLNGGTTWRGMVIGKALA